MTTTTADTVRSATIHMGEVVVFDLLPHRAGTPGTVTGTESADWTDADWERLAKANMARLRRTQRRCNMRGPRSRMSAEWIADLERRAHAAEMITTLVQVNETTIEERHHRRDERPGTGTLLGDWTRQQVPGMGLVWAWTPVNHAEPTAYSVARPQL